MAYSRINLGPSNMGRATIRTTAIFQAMMWVVMMLTKRFKNVIKKCPSNTPDTPANFAVSIVKNKRQVARDRASGVCYEISF